MTRLPSWDEISARFGGSTAVAEPQRLPSSWDEISEVFSQPAAEDAPFESPYADRLREERQQPTQRPLREGLDFATSGTVQRPQEQTWSEWLNPPLPQANVVQPVEGGSQGVATSQAVVEAQRQAAEQEQQRLAQLERERIANAERLKRIEASKADKDVVQFVDAAVRMISETPPTGIEAHTAAAKVPPEHREYFLDELQKRLASDKNVSDLGYGSKLGLSVVQGGFDFGTPLAKMAGALPELTPEQERMKRDIMSVREGVDPSNVGGFGGAVQSAGRMAAPMVMSVGAGKAATALGAGAGLGATGQAIARGVGTSGSFLPMTADSTYTELVSEGIDPETAKWVTVVSAPFEAALESIVPDPLSGYGAAFRGTIREVGGKIVKQHGVNYFKELSEEGLQAMSREVGKEAARAIDKKVPNKGLGSVLEEGFNAVAESASPLAIMMAPGGAINAASDIRQSAERPGRLEELQAQGTDNKPDITAEARKWATTHDNPETVFKVGALAENETVSRGAFEEAVGGPMRIGDRKLSQEERTAFSRAVRDTLAEVQDDGGSSETQGGGRGPTEGTERVNGETVSSQDQAGTQTGGVNDDSEQGSGVVGPNAGVVSGRPDTGGGRAPEHGGTGVGGLGERSPAEVEQVWRATVPGAAGVKFAPGKSEMLRQIQESQGASDVGPVDGSGAGIQGDELVESRPVSRPADATESGHVADHSHTEQSGRVEPNQQQAVQQDSPAPEASDSQPGDPQPTGVPEGLDPVAYRLGQKHSDMVRNPAHAGMKPGTLPWKSWLAGYDSQQAPVDSGTDTDVGTKPDSQSDDAELDAAFDAAFGEKFGEDKKPSVPTKEFVPVEQAAAAIESIDTSTRDGEFEAMTKVAEIADANGINPNELWRDVYFEPDGADRDIVVAEKPQPKKAILKRKPTPLETREQIKQAYEKGEINPQQVLDALSGRPADAVGTSRTPSGESGVIPESVRDDAAPVTEREPWQMTREEYLEGKTDVDAKAIAQSAHANHVKNAVAAGQPVPANVLEGYKSNGWAKTALEKQVTQPKAGLLKRPKEPNAPTDTGSQQVGGTQETQDVQPNVEVETGGTEKAVLKRGPQVAFKRSTPKEGDPERQRWSDNANAARTKELELEQRRKTLTDKKNGLRRNATKKRAAIDQQLRELGRQIGEQQSIYTQNNTENKLAIIDDYLERDISDEHRTAGLAERELLLANRFHRMADEDARRGDSRLARNEAAKHDKERSRLQHNLTASAHQYAQEFGLQEADELNRAAEDAVRDFDVASRSSLKDAVGHAVERVRAARDNNKDLGSELSPEQTAAYRERIQEAIKDDAEWVKKRDGIYAEAEAENDKLRDKRLKAEAATKEKERLAAEKAAQEELAESRSRAKRQMKDERFFSLMKDEAKSIKGKKSDATVKYLRPDKTEDDVDISGELVRGTLLIHPVVDWNEDTGKWESQKGYQITHVPTGTQIGGESNKTAMKQLIAMTEKVTGIDWSKIKTASDLSSDMGSKLKRAIAAWQNDNLSELKDTEQEEMLSHVSTKPTTVKADVVLDADDLGATGGQKLDTRGHGMVKKMAEVVPEFAYDPVFTVDDNKKLVYRDGYKYTFDPEIFNLHPSELTPGQTVGINLEDLGVKRATEQDVVAEQLKAAGFSSVKKPKSGTVVSASSGLVKHTIEQDGPQQWSTTNKAMQAAIDKIRWIQPGQVGLDVDATVEEVEAVADKVADAPELAPDTRRILKTKEEAAVKREAEAARKTPEGYAALPQKSQDAFDVAYESRDVAKMSEMIDPVNKSLRAEFERRSGVKLPRGVKATREAVDKFFGDSGKEHVRIAEKLADEMVGQYARNGYTTDPTGFREKYSNLSTNVRMLVQKQLGKMGLLNEVDTRKRKPMTAGDLLDSINGQIKSRDIKSVEQATRPSTSKSDPEVSAFAIEDDFTKQKFSAQRKNNAEPIGNADIIKTWERDFEVPIRRGKVGSKKGVQGIYKHLVEVVRLRNSEDVNLRVASHEVAHHVDQKTNAVKSMSAATKEVFGKLDYNSLLNRPKEGFAEFVSRYVMGEDVQVEYPQAYQWFSTQWAPANPEMAAKLGKAARHAQQYADQGAFARAKMLFPGRSPAPVDVLADDYKQAMQSFYNRSVASMVDQNRAFYLLDKEFEKAGGKFRNRESTYDLKLATDFTAPAHAERAMLEGVHTVSQRHQIIGPSLADALKDIKSYDDYQRAQAYAVALFTVEMADVQPGYNTGMRLDDAEFIIAEVEKNTDELKRYNHFADTLTAYNNALVEMAYDAGSITRKDMKAILGKTKHYVPLHREVGGKRAKRGLMAGAGLANLPPAFRRRSMEGSGLPVVDIVEASMRRTMDQYARAMKQQVVQSIVTTVNPQLNGGVKGLGKLAELIPPDMRSNVLRINEALDDLVEEGLIDADTAKEVKVVSSLRHGKIPSDKNIKWIADRYGVEVDSDTLIEDLLFATEDVADGEGLITYWRPSYLPNAGKNIVRLVVNGEPQLYQLDDVLFEAMDSMGQVELGAFGEGVKAFNHAFKTGAVGLSTGFGAANLVRDWWDAQAHSTNQGVESIWMPMWMLGKYAYAEVESLRSGGKPSNEFVRLFKEYGGELTTRLGYDKKSQGREKRKLFGGASKTSYLLDHPVQSLVSSPGKGLRAAEQLITMTDVGPRLAEFVAVMKKNGYSLNEKGQVVNKRGEVERPPRHVIVKAINAAGDATVNFKRVGRTMRKIDAYIPFTNAALQSRVRQVMAYKSLGKGLGDREAQRIAIMTLAFGALGYAAWLAHQDDDDNEERARWLKGSHFVLFNNSVRLPKSRDYRFVTNMTEALLEDVVSGKKGKAKEQFVDEAKEMMIGGGGVLREAFEQTANYDEFRQRPIETQTDARLHPWARFDDHTSLPAKHLGNITGHLFGMSPKRIDHLLDSTTGGMYRRWNRLGQHLLNGELDAKDIPGVNAFWMDKDYHQSLGDFYDAKWEAEQDVNTAKKLGDDTKAAKVTSKTLDDYEAMMTDIRASEGEEPTGENEKYIIGLARAALGREPLEKYPNPLEADPSDLTPSVAGVIAEYIEELQDTAYGMTNEKYPKPKGMPQRTAKDTNETYDARYNAWLDARTSAHETLQKRQGMLKRK